MDKKDYYKPIKRAFLQDQSLDILKKLVIDLKKSLFELRFSKKIGSVKNYSHFAKIKKNVARVKCEIFSRDVRY